MNSQEQTHGKEGGRRDGVFGSVGKALAWHEASLEFRPLKCISQGWRPTPITPALKGQNQSKGSEVQGYFRLRRELAVQGKPGLYETQSQREVSGAWGMEDWLTS